MQVLSKEDLKNRIKDLEMEIQILKKMILQSDVLISESILISENSNIKSKRIAVYKMVKGKPEKVYYNSFILNNQNL